MKRIVYSAGAACGLFLLLAQGSAVAAIDMQEGEWETTVETTVEGAGMVMPPMVSKANNCLTKDDLVPNPNPDQNNDCQVLDQKISGNTVTWRIVCNQDGSKMEGNGEMTYHGASYTGTMRTSSETDGQTMTAVMKMTGRHLGVCAGKKGAAPVNPELEKYKAMAGQAMARNDQEMAKYRAATLASGEIMKLPVPAADPSACRQQGFSAMADCAAKVGDLNLQPGLYQITLEKAARMGTGEATPVQTHKDEQCLTLDAPVPETLLDGREIRDVTRGREKINWAFRDAQAEVLGGLVYSGNTVAGVVSETTQLGPEMKMNQVVKVTGRRIGDGNCATGRAYTAQGRSYTSSQPSTSARANENPLRSGKQLIDNPVKGIRNILGL